MKYIYLILSLLLAPSAAKVYTGFNYGAFWSYPENVKRYADFHNGFELAKNLTTPVPFDSARLFTCITVGTERDPTEAFQAAIDTDTNLLLGMWVSPGTAGQSNDVQVQNELAALEKAFQQHGQKLADLIIGLSVGNEDIYRFNANTGEVGVAGNDMLLTINKVRAAIAASPYAKYMQGKPIGHTDTAQHAVVPGSDFVGMTAYPYWNSESIDNAGKSFMGSLKDTQQRAGNMSVWISEMGWPINGTQKGEAVASAENYQKYWDQVGCSVFGKYNTFWFELLKDSQPDQPDWGLLDTKTYQPRIRDLSCGVKSNASVGETPKASASQPQPTTLSTIFVPGLTSSSTLALSALSTTYTMKTATATVTPPSSAVDTKLSVCITMTDLQGNGIYIPVAIYPGPSTSCPPPPQFTGFPYSMVAAAAPSPSSSKYSSLNLYAPKATPSPTSLGFVRTSLASSVHGPTCVTVAGTAYEGMYESGIINFSRIASACPLTSTAIAIPTAILPSSIPATPSPTAKSPSPSSPSLSSTTSAMPSAAATPPSSPSPSTSPVSGAPIALSIFSEYLAGLNASSSSASSSAATPIQPPTIPSISTQHLSSVPYPLPPSVPSPSHAPNNGET
jgi:glucan endo-1,3-beta-D-glucosidase